MCGITGFCDFTKSITKEELYHAIQSLSHRGPDGEGLEIIESETACIGLAHKRLSVLDLSEAAAQPMRSRDGNIIVILNGEIYNHAEIRMELEKLGYHFKTTSDTEVILNGYAQWGVHMLEKFIGMFAMALLDKTRKSLFIFRDRAGVKPLYYYNNDTQILFASELKALHNYRIFNKEISEKAAALYFTYGYIPAPYSIFKNTYKLRPGHYLRIGLDNKECSEIKYYDVIDSYNKPKLRINEETARQEVEKMMTSSFNYRMISDVPVGVFLSGGYDSSVVAGILQRQHQQKIKTFTIGFEEENYNEAPFARDIAHHLGTDHYEYICTARESQDILPELPEIFDEPFGDSSAIPTILLSRFAKKHVSVALSADGGDELFAGYNRYRQLAAVFSLLPAFPRFARKGGAAFLNKLPLQRLPFTRETIRALSRISDILAAKNDEDIFEALNCHFNRKQLNSLLHNPQKIPGLYSGFAPLHPENDFLNKVLALDYKTYMPDDILVKVDRATMSCGLEGREPFLDHRLIDFVAQLPSDLKYKSGNKKYLLKKITHQFVPPHLLNRPKKGFSIPVYEWLRGELKEYIEEYINEKELSANTVLNTTEVLTIKDRFLSGKKGDEIQIWLILMFQMWWRRWMK